MTPLSTPAALDRSEPFTVIRVEWARADGDGSAPGVVPGVRVRQGSAPSFVIEPGRLPLRYRVLDEAAGARRCVGRSGFRTGEPGYVDCDNRAQVGQRLCSRCAIIEAGFAAGLHHAHSRGRDGVDPDIGAHLEQPNALYLAAFRDGSVKVGTSTLSRRDRRWAEQGAWRAAEVARTDDGYRVRHLEDWVTAEVGIAQSVGVGRKLAGMVRPVADDELDCILDEQLAKVTEALAARHDRIDTTSTGADGQRWQFPGSGDPRWQRLLAYPNDLATGTHDLEVDALCGRLAVVVKPTSGDRFAVDLGRLYGRSLFDDGGRPDEVLVQDALF